MCVPLRYCCLWCYVPRLCCDDMRMRAHRCMLDFVMRALFCCDLVAVVRCLWLAGAVCVAVCCDAIRVLIGSFFGCGCLLYMLVFC